MRRLPPRESRTFTLLPDQTGMGAVPLNRAKLVQEPAQFRLQSSAVLDEPLAVIGEELQVAIRSGEMSRGEVVFP